MQKPSIPKGTRDFGPDQMIRRNYIIDAIKKVFQKYGFSPIETPSLENLSVLTGKYGDEGDQLLFKILNSGDYLSNTTQEDVQNGFQSLTPKISKKGLRYDLTVPFARYVVMNQHDLVFPFKRYQIQPVWRADRPQKGRYQEFYQCDADVIGSNSLISESEILLMIDEVFNSLKFQDYSIKINNRKILRGIVEIIGAVDKETDFLVAIDKLDKIGRDKVVDELLAKGFDNEKIKELDPIFDSQGSNEDKLDFLTQFLGSSEIGLEGIGEMREIFELSSSLTDKDLNVAVDITLARGLSYYTGTIIEVKPTSVSMGSICGGGRYDDLTGVFGLSGVSGVGISFGVDRIYDVLTELDLFPNENTETTKVLVTNFGKETLSGALKVLSALRSKGINSEIYPEASKVKKQFSYANRKNIPFVVILGEEELKNEIYALKDMNSGTQQNLNLEQLLSSF